MLKSWVAFTGETMALPQVRYSLRTFTVSAPGQIHLLPSDTQLNVKYSSIEWSLCYSLCCFSASLNTDHRLSNSGRSEKAKWLGSNWPLFNLGGRSRNPLYQWCICLSVCSAFLYARKQKATQNARTFAFQSRMENSSLSEEKCC